MLLMYYNFLILLEIFGFVFAYFVSRNSQNFSVRLKTENTIKFSFTFQ